MVPRGAPTPHLNLVVYILFLFVTAFKAMLPETHTLNTAKTVPLPVAVVLWTDVYVYVCPLTGTGAFLHLCLCESKLPAMLRRSTSSHPSCQGDIFKWGLGLHKMTPHAAVMFLVIH